MVGGGQVTGAGMVAPGNVKDALPLPGVVNIEGRAVEAVKTAAAKTNTRKGGKGKRRK